MTRGTTPGAAAIRTAATLIMTAWVGVVSAAGDGSDAEAGLSPARRAWQNWTLNCQGCHRPDGAGSPSTAPALAGEVARFLLVPGGREYLGRVPGVAASPLGDPELAEVLNWMLRRFDPDHVPADFVPFTAGEIACLRMRPLRLEAAAVRARLLSAAQGWHFGTTTGVGPRESSP